jgi:hypothetical protein
MDRETSEFYNSHSPQFLVMASKNNEREILEPADGYGTDQQSCRKGLEKACDL